MSIYEMKPILFSERDVARLHRNYNLSADGCWLWRLALDKAGYGSMGIKFEGTTSTYRAHRASYTMLVGPIPRGKVLDHLCRVRNCVNPEHLEPVSQRENIRRGLVGVGENYAVECKWSHGEGEKVRRGDGSWYCRRCAVARQRAHRLGVTTKEAIEREDEFDVTMTRKKSHKPNPDKPAKIILDWSTQITCLDCYAPLRRRQDLKEKGVLLHAGRGKCGKCLKTALYGEKYNTTPYHVDKLELAA